VVRLGDGREKEGESNLEEGVREVGREGAIGFRV
jgi:hypothetical protein